VTIADNPTPKAIRLGLHKGREGCLFSFFFCSSGGALYVLARIASQEDRVSHAILNCISYLSLCSERAFPMYLGEYSACSGGAGHDSYGFSWGSRRRVPAVHREGDQPLHDPRVEHYWAREL
jgi:hypothetical protein